MRFNRQRMRQKGFSFLEVIVVVAILMLLATLVITRYTGRVQEAKKDKTLLQVKEVEKALEIYRLDNGNYPTQEQGLIALVEEPTSEPRPKKWKKLLDVVPKDSWDNELIYIVPGEHKEFDLYSLGPDKTEGTEDDIVNWIKEEDRENQQ